MKRIAFISALATLMLAGASFAFAQSSSDQNATSSSSVLSTLTYPIAELGNCDSRDACKLYCDQDANRDACFAYAQKVGLMSKDQVATAKLILKKQCPGQCDSKDACAQYCSDSSHTEECLSFAQTHNVIASSTVVLIKKLITGEGPGACKSAQTCKMYCEDSSHQDECHAFAEENGLAHSSSTRLLPPRMGTSTSGEVHAIIGSTTPGFDRGAELHNRVSSTTLPQGPKGGGRSGSTTPPTGRPGAASSTEHRPLPPTPSSGDNGGLGASVMSAFARLLGF